MSMVTLENSQLRLVVDPQQGVNVLAFFVQRAQGWLPVMPDVYGGNSDLKASSFVLIPYSNRIEGGRFTFQGQIYQLANAERHASHGDVRGRVLGRLILSPPRQSTVRSIHAPMPMPIGRGPLPPRLTIPSRKIRFSHA